MSEVMNVGVMNVGQSIVMDLDAGGGKFAANL